MATHFSRQLLLATAFFILPSVSSAAALTQQQANSLIAVVQSSPGTPASAFVSLITAFSNITTAQAASLIAVVQAAPSVPANSFVNLLTSFTVDTLAAQSTVPMAATEPTNSTPVVQTTPAIQTPTLSDLPVRISTAKLNGIISRLSGDDGVLQGVIAIPLDGLVLQGSTDISADPSVEYSIGNIYEYSVRVNLEAIDTTQFPNGGRLFVSAGSERQSVNFPVKN